MSATALELTNLRRQIGIQNSILMEILKELKKQEQQQKEG